MSANDTKPAVFNFRPEERYRTPYGIARVREVHGRMAIFVIEQPSAEATRCGYQERSTFRAHPDDQWDGAFPREWERLADPMKGGSVTVVDEDSAQVIARRSTVSEAVAFIDSLPDREKVVRGGYGIDVQEES